MPKYDLAISFAGEQRALARGLADRLDAAGYSIFYDAYHEAGLWGTDLTISLGRIYAHEARWCLVLVSQNYLKSPWTNLERQNALYRFMQERAGYLLCLRIDGAELPGLPPVIGYLDYEGRTEESIFALLLQRLGPPSHDDFIATIDPEDRRAAQEIISACFRRAIFTRMDAEINLEAMYKSISNAVGQIQRVGPHIRDPRLQFAAAQIVNALDAIERVRIESHAHGSWNLMPEQKKAIDDQKLQIIHLMLEIRRAAALPIQLPLTLRSDHIFRAEEADQAPTPDGW